MPCASALALAAPLPSAEAMEVTSRLVFEKIEAKALLPAPMSASTNWVMPKPLERALALPLILETSALA